METLIQDFRFGLRWLAKNAGFTAAAVLVLALGIGANITIFSVIRAVLLRPLPYPQPERLVQIWETQHSEGNLPSTISPLNFLDWAARNGSFDRMAVYAFSRLTLLTSDGPSRMVGVRVSGNFFSVFGTRPALGRTLGSEDDKPGSRSVVLSHRTWQSRFGGDPRIVGRTLTLDGQPHTIVGVMPRDFQFPNPVTELWTSPSFELDGMRRRSHFLFGIGRLKSNTTLAAAQSEAKIIARQLGREYPDTNEGSSILYIPLQEQIVGKVRRELLLLWGAATLVLLIACANVASLLLTRAISRQKEVSLRIAVGASRSRIIRQFLTEGVLLAFAGGAAAVIFSSWGTLYLSSGGLPRIPRYQDIHIDAWVLAFTLALLLLTVLIFGLAPAFHAVRGDLYRLLNQSSWQMPRGSWSQRLPKLVVSLEVGITVVLLISAGLLLESLWRLLRVDAGFETQGLLTMQLSLPESMVADPTERIGLFESVIERIGTIPGVDGVGGISDLPFSGSRTRTSFDIADYRSLLDSGPRSADYRTVAGTYFKTMRIPVLKGRTFTPGEGGNAPPVVVINQALAQRYFPYADPLGKHLTAEGLTAEIIGVVGNVKHESLTDGDAPEIYVPYAQGRAPEWIFLVVRSKLAPEPLANALRSTVREVLPHHPVYDFRSMEERLALSIAPQRLISLVLSIFAGLALILSSVGIYGVMAYAARQRRHEIAVRMALGASRGNVIRLVVLNGFIPAACGIVLGLAGALAAAGILRAMLFGSTIDPAAFLLVGFVLATVAILAGFLPAKRAAAVNPLTVLRTE